MEAVAKASFARYSYRKVGRVLDQIRGKTAAQGFGILLNTPQITKVLVQKTLKSAVSNLGKEVSENSILIKNAWANKGPDLKRVRAMAMGGRALYRRKTCHLTIVVSDEKK